MSDSNINMALNANQHFTDAQNSFLQHRRVAESRFPHAKFVDSAGETKSVTVWCSRDCLGMGQDPRVITAMKETLEAFGAGMEGTPYKADGTDLHRQLENELANLHNKEAVLLFSSGYAAGHGFLSQIPNIFPDSVILADAEIEASLIMGIRDGRGLKMIWGHNNMAHLERLLTEHSKNQSTVIALQSVYPTSDTFAPLQDVVDLAERYNAKIYLNEEHAVGLYGDQGAGLAKEAGVSDHVDFIQGTLGKCYGVMGGYIAGSRATISVVEEKSSVYIYGSSLPPSLVAGAHASVKYLRNSAVERLEFHSVNASLRQMLTDAGLPISSGGSHNISLIVGDARLSKILSDILLEKWNIFVQPINYPTVPRGVERIIITPSILHSVKDYHVLVRALSAEWTDLGLPRTNHFQASPLQLVDKWDFDELLNKNRPMEYSYLREIELKAGYIGDVEHENSTELEAAITGFMDALGYREH